MFQIQEFIYIYWLVHAGPWCEKLGNNKVQLVITTYQFSLLLKVCESFRLYLDSDAFKDLKWPFNLKNRLLTSTQNLSTAPVVATRRCRRRIRAWISAISNWRCSLKWVKRWTSTPHWGKAGKIAIQKIGRIDQLSATIVLRVLVLDVKVQMTNNNSKNFIEAPKIKALVVNAIMNKK